MARTWALEVNRRLFFYAFSMRYFSVAAAYAALLKSVDALAMSAALTKYRTNNEVLQ